MSGDGVWRVRRASHVRGALTPPGDKSLSHRAVMFGALAEGETLVDGWSPSGDCCSTLEIFRRLGTAIEFRDAARTKLRIEGRGLRGLTAPATPEPLDCGNSGTTTRLLMGVLAAHPFRVTLAGDASLSRRPMRRVVEPLTMMGARFEGADGAEHLPITMEGGPLTGTSFDLKIASAQLKSALLLAGMQATGVTRIKQPAASRDHTERQLTRLGAKLWTDPDGWLCVEGGVPLQAGPWQVPADLSAAAFFLVAAAIVPRAELELRGVGLNKTRDGILELLQKMGARITVTNQRDAAGEPVGDVLVKGGGALKGVRVAGDLIPRTIDEIPALCVAACFAEGVTVIREAAELRAKESDRIATMAGELAKLGAKVGVLPDGLAIEGGAVLKGAEVESHGDHRVAMSLAVAALAAEGETTIRDVGCVDTSYPGFKADLDRLTGVDAA